MIHPILADALPSWAETLTVVAFFLSIIGNLAQYSMSKTMRDALKQKQQISFDQPVIAKLEEEFVTKNDFQEHKQGNIRDFSELREKREEDLQAAGLSRSKIYDKIESTRADLSKEISDVPERVIAILRNFGVIGGGHRR